MLSFQDAYKRVVEFFGENPRTCSPTSFFSQFVRFVAAFKVNKLFAYSKQKIQTFVLLHQNEMDLLPEICWCCIVIYCFRLLFWRWRNARRLKMLRQKRNRSRSRTRRRTSRRMYRCVTQSSVVVLSRCSFQSAVKSFLYFKRLPFKIFLIVMHLLIYFWVSSNHSGPLFQQNLR